MRTRQLTALGAIAVLVLALVVSGCNLVPQLIEPTEPAVTPTPVTPVDPAPVMAPEEELEARLAAQLGVGPEQIELTGVEAVQWPDACLGVPIEDELCAQVITPGYRAMAVVDGELYEVRSDAAFDRIELLPGAIPRARTYLAGSLGVEEETVRLVSFEAVEWPDACLGVEEEGVMCAQVITPGFRIVFEVAGESYQVHTDQAGDAIAIASDLVTPPEEDDYVAVEVPQAALRFEIPATWAQLEGEWAWVREPEDDHKVGLNWAELQPPEELEAVLLPQPSQTLESEELETPLGPGREYLVEVYGPAVEGEQAPVVAFERHVLVLVSQNGTRWGYGFYASAPTQDALAILEPTLTHMVITASLEPIPAPPAPEPEAALRAGVAQRLGVVPEAVELTALEPVQWPDACLGLAEEDELCAQVITPGYRATAVVNDRRYEVRSDEAVNRVELVPAAVARARAVLARSLGVAEDEIELVRVEAVEWPDACLGVQEEGRMCLQVITPGYRIVFEVAGQQHRVHTDRTGDAVAIAP